MRYIYDGDNNLVKSVFNGTEITYYPSKLYNKVVKGAEMKVQKFYRQGSSQSIACRMIVGAGNTLNWTLSNPPRGRFAISSARPV